MSIVITVVVWMSRQFAEHRCVLQWHPQLGVDTASCMKALPAVRQFFNSNRTSPSLQLQPGATSSFKTYKSSTYMIQYPSDWTVNETNSRAE